MKRVGGSLVFGGFLAASVCMIPNRGHTLTIDSGWREVADTAIAFVKRFV
jgi:hypothetical protein